MEVPSSVYPSLKQYIIFILLADTANVMLVKTV